MRSLILGLSAILLSAAPAFAQLYGGGDGASITVKENDNTPTVSGVNSISFTNGTVTDDGGGGGGIGGATGATDNALIRADGTGGATIQASGCTLNDSDQLTCPGGFVSGTSGAGLIVLLEGTVVSAGTNYTGRTNVFGDTLHEDRVQTSAGSIAATFTTNHATSDYITLIATFKAASVASPSYGARLRGVH